MEIDCDSPAERVALAIERLLEGETLLYEGIVLHKPSSSILTVNSFSAWEPERASEANARDTINRSKDVLESLRTRSSTFALATSRLTHEYVFCYDYGQGSIALAIEREGNFKWAR